MVRDPNTPARLSPLMQPVTWEEQTYFTSHYFHQQYRQHMVESGRKATYGRHADFVRAIRAIPLYHVLVEQGDIVVLAWKDAGTQFLRSCFEAIQYNNLTLLNATAQLELTHHLDDPTSKAMAYTHNRASVAPPQKVSDGYPELKAIIELVEGVAASRKAAEAAQQHARDASTKADLALAQQQWLTIREYVYLHQLARQFPESQWPTFGRHISAYCAEHGVPVRRQALDGKAYGYELAYHVEVITQLLGPWLKRYHAQPVLRLPSTEESPL